MATPIRLISCDSDPLSEADIALVESAVGELPNDYREFLLHSNGGRTSAHEVRLPLSDDEDDVLYVTSFTVIEPAFPPPILTVPLEGSTKRLIAVAECYDSPILMTLNGHEAGAIHYWAYELEGLWDAEEAGGEYLPEDETVTKVARCFRDFVDRLEPVNSDEVPELTKMERTVENFAKHGDHFFKYTKEFFDSFTVDQLNEDWPKHGKYPFPPIHSAANWSQVQTAKYLIDRGVNTHDALVRCTNNFEISKLMIDAGATDEELRQLLLSASAGIACTSVPEEHQRIVAFLVERGIQPDFTNPDELQDWEIAVKTVHPKKILRFLLKMIAFPKRMADQINTRLTTSHDS